MLHLTDPVSLIPDLNVAQKRAIKAFGAETVGELINVLPRRYDDYSNTVSIRRAPLHEPVTLRVTVEKIANQPGFHRRIAMIRAVVRDAPSAQESPAQSRTSVAPTLKVIWFNQPWLLKELTVGREIFLSGTVVLHPRFGRQMSNPIWEDVEAAVASGTVAPVYLLTGSVAQKTMRELMAGVVERLGEVVDPLLMLKDGVLSLGRRLQGAEGSDEKGKVALWNTTLDQAIRFVHRPASLEEAERGRLRLAFDEFLVYRLALGSVRKEADALGAPLVPFDDLFAKKFVAALPYTLTADQKRSAWASLQEMGQERPMRRLLQGDVGSGKTAVGAFLLAMTFRSGQSGVFMAPTEILAQQHAASLRRLLEPASAPVLLLTSSKKILWEGGEEISQTLSSSRERIVEGRLIIIGTHAVLERGMVPPDTACVIVDEQHRFGVAQREALAVAKRPDGKVPHLLSMTATPIPRSLALTLYGDLNVSVIRTKPVGRASIATKMLVGDARENAYEKIRVETKAAHRSYIVCPLIDPSDTLGVKSATEEAKRLAAGPLKGLRIGLLHGRLSNADKDGVMREFIEGMIDVLVATTVVEVGVDVPEATVMMIEAAERFGLAQLHQLRGRVGRSTFPSFCYLLTDSEDPDAIQRLRVIEKTQDGFAIAEADLKNRGSGNVLGTQQSGRSPFHAARPWDTEIMVAARDLASRLLEEDEGLASIPALAERVESVRQVNHGE